MFETTLHLRRFYHRGLPASVILAVSKPACQQRLRVTTYDRNRVRAPAPDDLELLDLRPGHQLIRPVPGTHQYPVVPDADTLPHDSPAEKFHYQADRTAAAPEPHVPVYGIRHTDNGATIGPDLSLAVANDAVSEAAFSSLINELQCFAEVPFGDLLHDLAIREVAIEQAQRSGRQ
jgi:hypothetical protein